MQKMTLGWKVLALLLVGLGFVAVVAVTGFVAARNLSADIDVFDHEAVPLLQRVERIAAGIARANSNASAVENSLLEESVHAKALVELDAQVAQICDDALKIDAVKKSAALADRWNATQEALMRWNEASDGLVTSAKARAAAAGRFAEAASIQTKVTARFEDMRKAASETLTRLDETTVELTKFTDALSEDAASRVRFSYGLLAGAFLVAAAVLGLAGTLLARSVRTTLAVLRSESQRLRDAVGAGQLAVRGDAAKVDWEFRPLIEGMNQTMDAYAKPIAVTSDVLARISKGDIPAPITEQAQGDFNQINEALNRCIATVNALVADAGMLSKAAVEGKLSTRADASRHQGDFRRIVQGVNDTLDAVIGPLNVAARCMDGISRGAIPPKIAESYQGDFNAIKDNLNRSIDAVNLLIADAGMLARAGVEGRLATRADASRHQGDFRKIVEGVNATLDAVVGPLNVAARTVEGISKGAIPKKISESYAGDFATIRDNLNTCIDAVNLLVADAARLVDAAVAGHLATRADAAKHQGDFRKIVDGVNRTLDAVLAPVHDATSVLERLAQRDLRARVERDYAGDHARLKESVNGTAEALHDALAQVAQAVDQVSSAASQIASSSQAVASGASEQAASLQETTTTLESFSESTRRAAEGAAQGKDLADQVRGRASTGAQAVEQMQGAMGRIKKSAEGTSQIIKDINEIAFQTNLLALNAAVEAARAGEAGRGFAVVAEEVRSLALRAKEAATKTEALIRESLKEAQQGEATSAQVSAQLGEIVAGIGKVTDLVGEIADSSRAQAAAVDQVNKAVGEMDKVTQQNAASAEESSSAASELSAQSEELAAMVAEFRIDRAAAGPGRRHAPRLDGDAASRNGAARPLNA
jgi:methyl-accepting chemotaxis protein